MERLVARLGEIWRSIWTPPSVRRLEDEGLGQAVAALPEPDSHRDPWEGLDEIERRNRILEQRMRELSRLYGRRREDRGPKEG